VTNRSAAKGDAFERLIISYLRDEFGNHLSRPRAGATHDLGDIAGIPDWSFELKCRADLHDAVRLGLNDLAIEQANAGTTYGAVIVKRVGKTDPARQLFVCELGAAIPLIRETARWDVLSEAGEDVA
jgi:hypothetical protein